jgi:hypothetical protein
MSQITEQQEISLQNLAEQGLDITLQRVKSGRIYNDGWQNWNYQLSYQDIAQISELLGGREKTKTRVANKLRCLSTLPSHWSFNRIHWCKHSQRWAYNAGQDYPSELATIRKFLTSL